MQCSNNSYYVKPRHHLWIPKLVQDQEGGKETDKPGKFLFQVNVEALNPINLTEGYFYFFFLICLP